MKRIVGDASPVLILTLAGAWLLLNQSLTIAHLALGIALAIVLARAASTLRPLQARLRRIDVAAMLLLVVLQDIVLGNVAVARIVLGLSPPMRSGFLDIPLDLRDPHGLAALGAIVTATPGTVWSGLSPDGNTLTLHVLDLRDEQQLIRSIKDRYEKPLRRIFE